jgi:inosine-uridine nucleoside N-ribohydrolase
MDPELPEMLKQLVVMCGVFTYGLEAYTCLSEWNSRCDPHASAMVYAVPVKSRKSIGLDVTTQVTMEASDVRTRLTSPAAGPVLDFMAARTHVDGLVTFHDPLAAATIFEPSLCEFRRGDVEVVLDSKKLEGLTWLDVNDTGNDQVALSVDSSRFFRHYFDILN